MREKIIELLKQEDTKKVSIEDLISILNLSTSEEMKEAMRKRELAKRSKLPKGLFDNKSTKKSK